MCQVKKKKTKHEYIPNVSSNFTKNRKEQAHLASWFTQSFSGVNQQLFNQKLVCQWPCDGAHKRVMSRPPHQAARIQVKLLFGYRKVLCSFSCICYSCGPWIERGNSALVSTDSG